MRAVRFEYCLIRISVASERLYGSSLSFTHKLQTELKSQMNALKQGLQLEPAPSQGFTIPSERLLHRESRFFHHLCI